MSAISIRTNGKHSSRTDRITKVLLIIGLALILLCLYILRISRVAQGYEISIYDEYPVYFWYFIIISLFIGQLVLILNAICENDFRFPCASAPVCMVMGNAILLLLPLLRRYAIYGSEDTATHVGYMLDILRTGHIGNNMYPIDHILGIITSYLTGLDLKICTLIYPFIFYIIFVIFIFLAYRLLMERRFQILVGMSIAPLLLLDNANVSFLPNAQADSLAIFGLFLFFHRFLKKNIVQFELMIVIFAMLITFFHPLVCLILIFISIMLNITHYATKISNLNPNIDFRNSSKLTAILIILYFIWQSHAYLLVGSIEKVYIWLIKNSGGASLISQYIGVIDDAKPPLLRIINIFIYSYGITSMMFAATFLGIIMMIYAWKSQKKLINYYEFVFINLFLIFFAVYFISNFLLTGIGLSRLRTWAIFSSLFVIPFSSRAILARPKPKAIIKNILIIIVAISLLSISYLSVFTLFLSPLTTDVGLHVPFSQLDGANTFFKIRSEELQIIELGMSMSRYHDALYGVSDNTTIKNVIYYETRSIPDHFGYSKFAYFGDYYATPRYFVLSTLGRIYYPRVYPEFSKKWRDNMTDFNRLENDISVSKFYTNNEMEVYLLYPVSKQRHNHEKSKNSLLSFPG